MIFQVEWSPRKFLGFWAKKSWLRHLGVSFGCWRQKRGDEPGQKCGAAAVASHQTLVWTWNCYSCILDPNLSSKKERWYSNQRNLEIFSIPLFMLNSQLGRYCLSNPLIPHLLPYINLPIGNTIPKILQVISHWSTRLLFCRNRWHVMAFDGRRGAIN